MISYAHEGAGVPVVCLHGWPGAASDYRALLPLLERDAQVVVPDLLGFGASFGPADVERPATDFGRDAQGAAVLELMDHLGFESAVLVGYDVGSTTAAHLARTAPERVRALVLGNAIHPGSAAASLDDDHRAEFWYQDFHQLELASRLVDGSAEAVRTYLEHFWSHWGARGIAAVTDELVEAYARPGAFTVSVNWYRSGSATLRTALAMRDQDPPPPVTVPTTVLWGDQDPLFPPRLADGLDRAFTDLRGVHHLEDVGHFVPLEAANEVAAAVRAFL
ncbi:pimeloyl-ACP methyl ester carboxylesterase [Actinomycetospora succinea]|uniref:Pimeloyl-ACP methyl ester carboxylesterase n=1 Tax=Actinomycetospora succinea TaxID=663603 RepID=A0A4R6V9N2_9PSEU|nr:alpha/beta hydrolase [Actinomycetospora succinea]TDQ58597.1 pimeloyl-ACP methyl ester carboxylesterase [Actinomycetospora succinea]